MQHINMTGSTIKTFDARGAKLTFEFLERTKFDQLVVDEQTKLFDLDGNLLKVKAVAKPVINDGKTHFILACEPVAA